MPGQQCLMKSPKPEGSERFLVFTRQGSPCSSHVSFPGRRKINANVQKFLQNPVYFPGQSSPKPRYVQENIYLCRVGNPIHSCNIICLSYNIWTVSDWTLLGWGYWSVTFTRITKWSSRNIHCWLVMLGSSPWSKWKGVVWDSPRIAFMWQRSRVHVSAPYAADIYTIGGRGNAQVRPLCIEANAGKA